MSVISFAFLEAFETWEAKGRGFEVCYTCVKKWMAPVCACVRACVCVRVRARARARACVCGCVWVYVYARARACMRVAMW